MPTYGKVAVIGLGVSVVVAINHIFSRGYAHRTALARGTEGVMVAGTAEEIGAKRPPDAIIILGGGRPSTLLNPPSFVKNRCDVAAKIHNKAKAQGIRVPLVTLSAGTAHASQLLNSHGRPIWEASASAAYMVKEHGVSPKDILMETTSWDTIGNAYFARTQIVEYTEWKRIWVVTSNFHMPRSKAIFDWIFQCSGGTKTGYELSYIETENVGLTDVQVKARQEREARSLANVHRQAKEYPTLRDVMFFLLQDHGMYSVKGLNIDGDRKTEDISEDLKKSYQS